MRKALIIGINYNGSEQQLRGCLNDVKNIKNILINKYKFNDSEIIEISEEKLYPLKKNIQKSIEWLVNLPENEENTLFFYYSGHGSYIIDTTNDEKDGKDELIIPIDYKISGYISDDWLYNNMIEKIKKNTSLIGFIDCCHSGTLFDLEYTMRPISQCKKNIIRGMPFKCDEWKFSFLFDTITNKKNEGKCVLLSGCQDSESSIDTKFNNIPQGAFTYCLLNILNEKTDLNMLELSNEITARLILLGFKQQPILTISNIELIEKSIISYFLKYNMQQQQ